MTQVCLSIESFTQDIASIILPSKDYHIVTGHAESGANLLADEIYRLGKLPLFHAKVE